MKFHIVCGKWTFIVQNWNILLSMEGNLYYLLITSPIHAHELGEEFVENLAGYDGSIQNIYVDNMNSINWESYLK